MSRQSQPRRARRRLAPLTVRRTTTIALGCLLVAVSGCSGPSGTGTSSTSSGVSSGLDDAAFPVTIKHMLGEATITKRPDRVVTLGLAEGDIALALGVTPVAMVGNPWSDDHRFPWVGDDYDLSDVQFLPMDVTTTSAERIAALRPDLVIATTASADAGMYEDASGFGVPIIAPLTGPMTDSWQDMTRAIGKALGLSARAEQLIADVEAKIAATRNALPGIEGRTFVVASASSPTQLRVVDRASDANAQFFGDLGMQLPSTLTSIPNATSVGATDISNERLDLLESDALFLSSVDDNRDRLEQRSGFQALTSVATGAYLAYDNDEAFGMRVPSPLSIPYLLERVRPVLEKVDAAAGRSGN